jgi:peptide deformylase
MRQETVVLDYVDENFVPQQKTFIGLTARIILHEYDHIDGKLFIDHISPLKRTLLRRKLDDISKGRINTDYRMLFPK